MTIRCRRGIAPGKILVIEFDVRQIIRLEVGNPVARFDLDNNTRFNTDDVTGGIWKHLPAAEPKPVLTISIVGGKGFTVTVKNIGDGEATDVTCDITIAGGLFINPKTFNENQATLGVGANFTVTGAPKGIGLGLLKPIPTITIDVNCTQGIGATKTIGAKIFFSKVTLQ